MSLRFLRASSVVNNAPNLFVGIIIETQKNPKSQRK
jgi:hypothetical protein